jgi:predicted ATP-binding protein involved in virulence
MRITQIQLQNIGAFENETIIFKEKTAPEKAEIHIFVGENGTGKSTLLYALAAWRIEDDLIHKRFRNKDSMAEISFSKESILRINSTGIHTIGETSEIQAFLDCQNYYNTHKFSFAGFAYSGNRSLIESKVESYAEIEENPFKNALGFDKTINNKLLIQAIANAKIKESLAKSAGNQGDEAIFGEVTKIIEKVVSDIIEKEIKFHLNYNPLEVVLSWENKKLNFEVLPDGLKSILSWISDLLLRLSRIPWENDTPILERNFILFLDEIEIHLHPAWQRKILPVIQNLFPNAQIFLATHSPFVANSVDGAYIYELENRNGNTKIAEIVISKTDQSIDSVLDKIFGVNEKYGESTQDELENFYQTRDKILAKETVNEQDFLQKARHLAFKNAQIQTKIQFELNQLQRITGREVWKI